MINAVWGRELIRYCLIGFSGVIIDYGVYQMLLHIGYGMDISKLLSFSVGAGYIFVMQRRWTFRSNGRVSRQLSKYILLYISTAALNTAVNSLMMSCSGIYWLSFICATGSSTIGNYLGQKYLVFK